MPIWWKRKVLKVRRTDMNTSPHGFQRPTGFFGLFLTVSYLMLARNNIFQVLAHGFLQRQ